jgi:starch synthase (maltosyl-transferring)
MYRLAKVGFSQSYTYFTWRHTKQEFIDYLTELTGPESRESLHAAPRDFFRPNFFVNTPDINPVFLQRSGRAGFLIRAALASMLSGLWGVYSGFELCEGTPVPGKEDYLDSEKYQLRAWDWQRPGNIVAEISALNRIRNENPALRTHLNVRFQNVFDPNILYFTKATEDRSNVVVVAINLDPYGVHEADFELPLWEWGRSDDAAVEATDLLDGHRFRWHGKTQRMRLDPGINPYAVWRVTL